MLESSAPYTSPAAERVALLESAIELSDKLTSVLAQLGPNSFKRVCSPSNDATAYIRIQTLEGDLSVKMKTMSRYRNDALAPYFRLSEDLLCHIFDLALTRPRHYGWDLRPRYPRDLEPVQITTISAINTICSRWRQLAMQTATLWSTVALTVPERSDPPELAKRHPNYRSFILTPMSEPSISNLTRSKNAPLDVILRLTDTDLLQSVIDAFTTHCACRTRRLQLEGQPSVNHLFMAPPGALPATLRASPTVLPTAMLTCLQACRTSLRSLMWLSHDSWNSAAPEMQEVYQQILDLNFPRLRNAIMDMTFLQGNPSRINLLSRCTSIELRITNGPPMLMTPNGPVPGATPRFNLEFLVDCRQLQELKIVSGVSNTIGRTAGRIDLPNLKRLDIPSDRSSLEVLSMLRAPQLLHLSIKPAFPYVAAQPPTPGPDEVSPIVIEFLNQSLNPSLQSLEVGRLASPALKTILRACDSITLLRMEAIGGPQHGFQPDDVTIIDAYLSLLSERPEGSDAPYVLCPQLKILDLGLMGTSSNFERLTSLAKSRREVGHPLQELKLDGWGAQYGAARHSMQNLIPIANFMEIEAELGALVERLVVGKWVYSLQDRSWTK